MTYTTSISLDPEAAALESRMKKEGKNFSAFVRECLFIYYREEHQECRQENLETWFECDDALITLREIEIVGKPSTWVACVALVLATLDENVARICRAGWHCQVGYIITCFNQISTKEVLEYLARTEGGIISQHE